MDIHLFQHQLLKRLFLARYVYMLSHFSPVQLFATLMDTQVRSLGGEDALEKARQPPPVFLPGESHGQRSLVGSSPCGCKELDTTEMT